MEFLLSCFWTLHIRENKLATIYVGPSVVDRGCLSRIRIFPSRIQGRKDPGSASASKNLSIFNPKKTVSKLSEKWSGMVIPDLDIFPHPGLRGQKSTGSQIRNNGLTLDCIFISCSIIRSRIMSLNPKTVPLKWWTFFYIGCGAEFAWEGWQRWRWAGRAQDPHGPHRSSRCGSRRSLWRSDR